MVGWSLLWNCLLLGMFWPTNEECAHEWIDHWISWLLLFTTQENDQGKNNNSVNGRAPPFLTFHPWDQRNIAWSMEKERAEGGEHGRRGRGRIQNVTLWTCIHRASRAPWSMVYCLMWLLFMLIEREERTGRERKIIPRVAGGSVRAIWISLSLPCRPLVFLYIIYKLSIHQMGWVRLREQ